MAYCTEKDKFVTEIEYVSQLLRKGVNLPNQVFQSDFKYFGICDFGFISTDEYYENLKNYLVSCGERFLKIVSLDPDPIKYFYNNFGTYPYLEISVESSNDEYIKYINEDPGGSPADSIAMNGRTLVYYTGKNDWAIFCNAELEVCIVAFKEKESFSSFKKIGKEMAWLNVEEALKNLFVLNELSKNERNSLKINYAG